MDGGGDDGTGGDGRVQKKKSSHYKKPTKMRKRRGVSVQAPRMFMLPVQQPRAFVPNLRAMGIYEMDVSEVLGPDFRYSSPVTTTAPSDRSFRSSATLTPVSLTPISAAMTPVSARTAPITGSSTVCVTPASFLTRTPISSLIETSPSQTPVTGRTNSTYTRSQYYTPAGQSVLTAGQQTRAADQSHSSGQTGESPISSIVRPVRMPVTRPIARTENPIPETLDYEDEWRNGWY